jgi:hypothetical protein
MVRVGLRRGASLLLPAYEAAERLRVAGGRTRVVRTAVLAAAWGLRRGRRGRWRWSAREADRPDPPPEWEALRDQLAERTLRKFAQGLIGFGDSSLAHLRDNFLTGGGQMRVDDESISVRLPSVPLQLVLRIAGWHGREYEVPWLAPRIVRIRLDGD